jgi:hypothetical protein
VSQPPRTRNIKERAQERAWSGWSTSCLVLILMPLSTLMSFCTAAHAVEVAPPVERIETCAVLKSFSGELQIFNADRSGYLDVEPGVSVPCGGWISVGQGHAVLTHRDGYWIQL